MGRSLMGTMAGEKDEHLKKNLYVSDVEKWPCFPKMPDRFDISLTGVNSSQQGPGHMSGSTGPSGNAPFGGMTAMLDTNVEFVDYNCWFPDSGAINHVANELGISSSAPSIHGMVKFIGQWYWTSYLSYWPYFILVPTPAFYTLKISFMFL